MVHTCTKDHTGEMPQEVIDKLPESQSAPLRHRCAACAYLIGLEHGAQDMLVQIQTQLKALEATLDHWHSMSYVRIKELYGVKSDEK